MSRTIELLPGESLTLRDGLTIVAKAGRSPGHPARVDVGVTHDESGSCADIDGFGVRASPVTPKERVELAQLAGLNEQYLYQCITGRKNMDATEAVRVERITKGRLRRWHLRRDWRDTWPELIGAFNAPQESTGG